MTKPPKAKKRQRPASPLHLEYAPDAQRLLRAKNEFFSAASVWNRRDGIWSCILAAPALSWMRGLDPKSAKVELVKRGYSIEWSRLNTHNLDGLFFVSK